MDKQEDIHIRARRSIMLAALGVPTVPELERHLEGCQECQKVVPILRIKAEGFRITNLAAGILHRSLKGDQSILSRKDRNFVYFFEAPQRKQEQGQMVVFDFESKAILEYKLASIEEFLSFEYDEKEQE
jgi:hypothetical protein